MRERILVIARGFECEEEFYDQEKSSAPTIEELRANQTESGYPSGHTANFSEPRPRAWPCPENEFTSSMTLNALTLNHENYTKNAKLNGRELASMPTTNRPLARMLLRISARVVCLNEADAFLVTTTRTSQGSS